MSRTWDACASYPPPWIGQPAAGVHAARVHPVLLFLLLAEAAAAAAAGGESTPKKAKKQQQQQQGAKAAGGNSAAARRPLAVVGDTQLAATRPAIVRELYTECAALSAMPESEVQALLEQRRTAVDGSSLRPVMSFEQTGLPAEMLHATRDFVQPSPIQSQVGGVFIGDDCFCSLLFVMPPCLSLGQGIHCLQHINLSAPPTPPQPHPAFWSVPPPPAPPLVCRCGLSSCLATT